jgi:hypothetical protein
MSNLPTVTEFIGVYDADATLVGEVSYWIGARLGTRHCSLCELTHGLFTVKNEWKECRRSLSVPVVTYHRNDAPADVLAAAAGVFPVVLERTAAGLSVFLTAAELDGLSGSTERFAATLARRAGGS